MQTSQTAEIAFRPLPTSLGAAVSHACACMSTLKIMLGGDGTGASHGVQTWEGNTEKGRGKTGKF